MAEKAAYVCSHVFGDVRPVLLVCKEGGDWQFLCGGDHDKYEVPKVVGINHLLARDESLIEILDLEEDCEAEREVVGGSWTKRKI